MSEAVHRDGTAVREISLWALVAIGWRHKWWIILGGLLAGCLGYATSYLVRPIYRATVVVMPAAQEERGLIAGLAGQLGSLASVAGIDLQPQGVREEALEYLSSRAFATEFVRRQQGLAQLFPERWDGVSRSWKHGREPTPNEAFRRFDKKVRSVFQNRKTGSISISVTLADRRAAARWADGIVSQLNEQLRKRAVDDSRRSVGFLQEELARTQLVDVRQAISRLMESQFQTIMVANVREQYALRVIDPAVIPDSQDRVRPMRSLYAVVAATVAGLLLTLVFVVRDLKRESLRTL